VTVDGVKETGTWETVYNLRIADYHTYFVGCDEWGFSVWAHNAYSVGKDLGGGWHEILNTEGKVVGKIQGKQKAIDHVAGLNKAAEAAARTPADIAKEVTAKYKLLQCEECANALAADLKAAGHSGEIIEIQAIASRPGGARPDFIVSNTHGGHQSITQNGRHVGVRVGDTVYDNIHKNGIPYKQWLADFDAINGVEVTKVTGFAP
jgi:hypothetical protein